MAHERALSRRRRLLLPAAWCLAGALLAASPAEGARPRKAPGGPIHYTLALPEPASRWVELSMQVPDPRGKSSVLAMPAWAPGSYLIRDFGRHVYELQAETLEGEALPVTRLDKQRWRVEHGGAAFRVDYRVYADELSVRTSYVDDRMGLLNGTSVFLYLEGELERPAQLRVGQRPAGWDVHTSLPSSMPGRYEAPDYDALVDAPLLLGEAEVRSFRVGESSFDFVFVAPSGSNADVDRLAADSQKVVEAFADIMGGLPFSHYEFLMVADAAGGGGLEHKDSTAMILPPFMFTNDEAYLKAARLVAHEFFHAWNVKRIHDVELGPFDYAQETYTDLLWFHEGFTETMEARAVLRAGLMDPQAYLADLAKRWESYRSRPGSDHTPISQLSREAWIKTYKPSPSHRNVAVSYYLKGDMIGVALDLELRRRAAAHGREGSLEGLFRRLWAKRDPKTQELPITRDDVVAAASAEAGEDMSEFFARHVDGTVPVDLPAGIEAMGFEVFELLPGQSPPPPEGDASKAETPKAEKPEAPKAKGWIGIGGSGELAFVDAGSPAEAAGLAVGDEPVALDGAKLDSTGALVERIASLAPGTRVRLEFFRRGRLDRRFVRVAADPARDWVFRPREQASLTPELAKLRAAWWPESSE